MISYMLDYIKKAQQIVPKFINICYLYSYILLLLNNKLLYIKYILLLYKNI